MLYYKSLHLLLYFSSDQATNKIVLFVFNYRLSFFQYIHFRFYYSFVSYLLFCTSSLLLVSYLLCSVSHLYHPNKALLGFPCASFVSDITHHLSFITHGQRRRSHRALRPFSCLFHRFNRLVLTILDNQFRQLIRSPLNLNLNTNLEKKNRRHVENGT